MKRQRIRRTIILISFLLFPITMNFLSPYVIIAGAGSGLVVGSFISFGIFLVGSMVLGRAFCGWVCPAGGMQEACFAANGKKVRGRIVNLVKYIIWVPWLSIIAAMFISAGGIHGFAPLYLTESGISVDEPVRYIIYYFVVGTFVLLSLLMGKRAGCHTICWMAPFMVLGGKLGKLLRIPALHLEADKGKCNGCKACEAKCPMSLEVNRMVTEDGMGNNECILCGECVDTCSKKVIQLTFGNRFSNRQL